MITIDATDKCQTSGITSLPADGDFDQNYFLEQPYAKYDLAFPTIRNDECEFNFSFRLTSGTDEYTLDDCGLTVTQPTFTRRPGTLEIFDYNEDGRLDIYSENESLWKLDILVEVFVTSVIQGVEEEVASFSFLIKYRMSFCTQDF